MTSMQFAGQRPTRPSFRPLHQPCSSSSSSFSKVSPGRKHKNIVFKGCSHSTVYSSAPTILLPRVRAPSTPFIVKFVLLYYHMKSTDINKRRPSLAHFFKNIYYLNMPFQYIDTGEFKVQNIPQIDYMISFYILIVMNVLGLFSTIKIVDLCGIRTRIVGVEGKHADHLDTRTVVLNRSNRRLIHCCDWKA